MKLYKYTSVKYAIEAINNGIFANELTVFNDPYEYEGIEYIDNYRVCCLTSSPMKMLMWAYYGNHRGCCIEFEVPDDIEIIRNVEYTKDYYQHRDMTGDEIFDNLYKKSYEWHEEKEIRIVYYEKSSDKSLWQDVKGKLYFKANVTKIMLGMQCDLLSEDVQDLFRYVGSNGDLINISKCMIDNRRYGLKENKQFDYKKHVTCDLSE